MTEDEVNQEFLDMATAVGFLIINWALIERQIDNWAYCVFHKCDGASLTKNNAIPKMFTKKKEFLAKCFNQLPLLAEYKEDGLRMLGEAFDTSLKKNNFTHGTLDSMVAENGVFHFHRLQHAETNFAVETFEFNPRAEWPILEKSLLALLRDSSQLSASLRNRFLTKPK